MKVIICLDKNNGMAFNHRRQSRDQVLIDDIIESLGDNRLLMNPYSETLFPDLSQLVVLDAYLLEAGPDDFCFVELEPIDSFISKIDELIIYRWNRDYPADTYFETDLSRQGFSLDTSIEFKGSSHDKITKEVYKK